MVKLTVIRIGPSKGRFTDSIMYFENYDSAKKYLAESIIWFKENKVIGWEQTKFKIERDDNFFTFQYFDSYMTKKES